MVKVGDAVWYYFLHAFCTDERTCKIARVYVITGRFEMRCRIARVTEVNPVATGWDARLLGTDHVEGRVHLQVEFQEDDRIRIPGGVGCRPTGEIKFVRAHDSVAGLGHIYKAWPEPNRWAFTQKTVDKE